MTATTRPFDSEKARALFASRLNALLKAKHVTRREVAAYVGVHEAAIGRWALKKGLPRYIAQIERLAAFFGVSKTYFLEEQTESGQLFVAATFRERSLLMAYRAADEDGKKRIEEVAGEYLPPMGS